jgi:hypothetical protein
MEQRYTNSICSPHAIVAVVWWVGSFCTSPADQPSMCTAGISHVHAILSIAAPPSWLASTKIQTFLFREIVFILPSSFGGPFLQYFSHARTRTFMRWPCLPCMCGHRTPEMLDQIRYISSRAQVHSSTVVKIRPRLISSSAALCASLVFVPIWLARTCTCRPSLL